MLRSARLFPSFVMPTRRLSSVIPRTTPARLPSTLSSSSDTHHSTNKQEDLITHVLTKTDAKRVLKVLFDRPDVHWACDTETTGLDVKAHGPVGNGSVICVSIYGGPDIDFGDGPGSALWIENIDSSAGVLQEFKGWFEDPRYKKVWHNYGFDRHVMFNEGINCQGLSGDTMHMARLWNTGLDKMPGQGKKGYSLAALTSTLCADKAEKTSMKDIFGVSKKLNNGGESKIKEIPDTLVLQQSPQHREMWIKYSARDAVATWYVREELEKKLKECNWMVDGRKLGSMYDFYTTYLCRFAELLTDMERVGIKVDAKGHIKEAEKQAREDRAKMEELFLSWAERHTTDGRLLNTGSAAQIQQFLFGQYKDKKLVQDVRTFRVNKTTEDFEQETTSFSQRNPYSGMKVAELKAVLKERNLQTSGKKQDLIARLQSDDGAMTEEASVTANSSTMDILEDADIDELRDICNARNLSDIGTATQLRARLGEDTKKKLTPPKSHAEVTIQSLKLEPTSFTPAGCPQVSTSVLKELSGEDLFGDEKDARWGTLYDHFGGGDAGRDACRAVGALARVGQIDTMISNFLVPLQALVDEKSRIHCSLNLNTETGRLSSRKPNLQNQPALEKDQYKIRDAFIAEEGKTFIVADYGQLELRILAHMTKCKSMIDAFASGGCFHSRTAVGMYPHIREAIEKGEVLLEWDYAQGAPPKPLVKDVYGSERRKAKTLNFSIAYGKTVHGLANDWGITKKAAEETLEAWYADRPEVKDWQEKTKVFAKKNLYVQTLMGRRRDLPLARANGRVGSASMRAAINTPIQGSAADVVMMAMLKLRESKILRELGWKLILQIHDEVIMEGPKESRDEAMAEVMRCMENPFDDFALSELSVHLDVDAKSADSWYKAK